MKADAVVRARIPSDMKEKAVATLDQMGLSTSDLIRMTLLRVAEEGRIPFPVEVPNKETRQAMEALESGEGKRCKDTEELFRDLDI